MRAVRQGNPPRVLRIRRGNGIGQQHLLHTGTFEVADYQYASVLSHDPASRFQHKGCNGGRRSARRHRHRHRRTVGPSS